ncbi:hypothetical protein ACFQ07_06620, partial [Actinomadura adrarensis]
RSAHPGPAPRRPCRTRPAHGRPPVHALLNHLEREGFPGSPRNSASSWTATAWMLRHRALLERAVSASR